MTLPSALISTLDDEVFLEKNINIKNGGKRRIKIKLKKLINIFTKESKLESEISTNIGSISRNSGEIGGPGGGMGRR